MTPIDTPNRAKGAPLAGQPEVMSFSVERLVELGLSGELVLPDFQRGYRWKAGHRLELIDSIFRGYPIGSLLLWVPPEWDRTESRWGSRDGRPLLVVPVRPGPVMVLVDGQQRAATLAGTLAPPDDCPPDWRMYFDTRTAELFYPTDRTPSAWDLPLSEVYSTVRFLDWLQGRPPVEDREARVRMANMLVKQIRDYRIPAYVVRGSDDAALREVFDRMNTRGVPLQAPEVFNALLAKDAEVGGLHEAAARLEERGVGPIGDLELLKGIMAVLGMDVTRDFRAELRRRKDDPDLAEGLVRAERAYERVLAFLTGECRIPHLYLMPYRFVLPVLVAYFDRFEQPEPGLLNLRRWLWNGSFLTFERANASDLTRFMNDVRVAPTPSFTSAAMLNRVISMTKADPAVPAPLDRWDLRSGRTKVIACVLAAQGPRDLRTGRRIDVRATISQHGHRAFPEVEPGMAKDQRSACVNRFLHAPVGVRPLRIDSSPELLASHGIWPGPDWFERRADWLRHCQVSFADGVAAR